jgi:spore germination cell wall hydrolase CwlJ-like protein
MKRKLLCSCGRKSAAIILVLACASAQARVTDADAVRAIIGEAANQGNRGMLAVACAIRNRDKAGASPLAGVYGLQARHVDHEPAWVWARARAAWIRSATADITAGATHWENTAAFGVPYWARTMTATVTVGNHRFFKP